MSRILRLILFPALIVLTVPFAGCKQKEAPPPAQPARVSATEAYKKYFGPAPTTDKGTCYAFVIYFPSARERGKVVPFPFFAFDEASIEKVAVERLLGGMDVASYAGELLQPFAAGTRLLGVAQEKGTITVDFSREILISRADEAAGKGGLNAVVLTLSQFPGVKDVRVKVDGRGQEKIMGTGGMNSPLVPDEAAVVQPSPPRLLSITAVKEKGATEVAEVSAYFDRPVAIQEISMADNYGKPFAGDMYHSVFDMAAVLKPKEPRAFQPGMPVKIRWKVTDKLGRHAEGDSVYRLEVKEH